MRAALATIHLEAERVIRGEQQQRIGQFDPRFDLGDQFVEIDNA